jgi:hypothetical protein
MMPKRQLIETTSQLGLAQVEASVKQLAGQRTRRFELFAESFRGFSSGFGSVRMAWRAHADDEEFDEACEVAAGLCFKEVSRSEAARMSKCRGDP